MIFPREIEVALVMGGAAEDRAGAVIHQDEIGDVDRQFPRGCRTGGGTRSPVSKPSFSAFSIRLLGGAAAPRLGAEGRETGVVRLKLLGEGVIG